MQIISPWFSASFAADRQIMDLLKKGIQAERERKNKAAKLQYLAGEHVYEERYVGTGLPTGADRIQVTGSFAWHLNKALQESYRLAIVKEIDDGVAMGKTTIRSTRWFLTDLPINQEALFDESGFFADVNAV